MKLHVTSSDPTVLVTRPGPRASETVHTLLDQGARVTVALAPEAADDPRLRDLESRGLVRLVTDARYDEYAVVLRDPHPVETPTPAPLSTETAPPTQTAPPTPTSEPRGDSRDNGAGPMPVPESPTRATPTARATPAVGRVILVGGGPGTPGLLTVDGLAAVQNADVLVCDRLAPLGVLDQARTDAEVVHVGKIPRGAFTPQEAINDVLIDRALQGKTVVRFKGGDNFVFGRGGEEWNACVARGIPVDVIPGVTSAVAVPALAGIPVTHRSLTQGFVVVSGHVSPGDPRGDVDWERLAGLGLTLVILMGVAALDDITTKLLGHGMDPATPGVCIADGGLPSMRVARAPLSALAAEAHATGISAPAVTVIGEVATALTPQDSAATESVRESHGADAVAGVAP